LIVPQNFSNPKSLLKELPSPYGNHTDQTTADQQQGRGFGNRLQGQRVHCIGSAVRTTSGVILIPVRADQFGDTHDICKTYEISSVNV